MIGYSMPSRVVRPVLVQDVVSNCFSMINLYVLKAAEESLCRLVTWGQDAVAIKPEVGGGIYWTKVSVDLFASYGG
jgi:hypothetical protein